MINWGDTAAILMIIVGAHLVYESEPRQGCFAVDFTDLLPSVVIGACDYYWSNLSGLRYASCGGRCYDGLDCGCSCLHAHASSANAYWSVGACIVITLGVFYMVSGLLCMVADVRIRHSVVRITFP